MGHYVLALFLAGEQGPAVCALAIVPGVVPSVVFHILSLLTGEAGFRAQSGKACLATLPRWGARCWLCPQSVRGRYEKILQVLVPITHVSGSNIACAHRCPSECARERTADFLVWRNAVGDVC